MREERERSALAHAALASLRSSARVENRGPQQRFFRKLRGVDHRGVVLAPVCSAGKSLAALRYLCLESDRQTRPARRWGVSGSACALCAAGVALWLKARRPYSTRVSLPRVPILQPAISQGRSRRHVSSKAALSR